MLRGGQSLGDLRARASRMVSIDSLTILRQELAGLVEQQFVSASGPLERRGVEVDHTFYESDEPEARRMAASPVVDTTPHNVSRETVVAARSSGQPEGVASVSPGSAPDADALSQMRSELSELRQQLGELQSMVGEMREQLDEVRRSAGL